VLVVVLLLLSFKLAWGKAPLSEHLAPELALIPAGSFLFHDREVVISHDFYLGTREVSQELYLAVMGENPSHFSTCGTTCPVENVSWYDAVAFLNELSVLEGLEPCYRGTENRIQFVGALCSGYRLPTEAEWQYAAEGGENYRYAGHETISEAGWYRGNSQRSVHKSCEKKGNGYGLCDMSGNVWEWTGDGWNRSYYSSAEGVDPVAPFSEQGEIVRSGSWRSGRRRARIDARHFAYPPSSHYNDLGFRICRTVL
jgi:formylglycine-generating enzyme required for sulfatase activity